MFSFFRRKAPTAPAPAPATPDAATPPAAAPDPAPAAGGLIGSALVAPLEVPAPPPAAEAATRPGWMSRLAQGLRKTGAGISQVFTGAQIDDALYEELESALLVADTGVAATQALLDDAYVNVEAWIAEEVEQAFAAQERAAFVSGDGTNKPKGFLAYDKIADASHAWDKVGFILSGGAGAFAASNPVDRLLDLAYAPRAEFRQNGRFVMNRKTVSAIRKLKDGDVRYVWQPETQGAGASILGYPVTEIEDMPDIAADAFAIAFGDFQRFYLVVDRAGVTVLRDPFTNKPYVMFYVTKRVGGGVQNFDAVKLMKFAAS